MYTRVHLIQIQLWTSKFRLQSSTWKYATGIEENIFGTNKLIASDYKNQKLELKDAEATARDVLGVIVLPWNRYDFFGT